MKKKALLVIASLLVASSAFAESNRPELDKKWAVGGLLGAALTTGNSNIEFGADLMSRFNEFWGAGLYATYLSNSATAATITTKTSTTVLAAEGSYYFDEALRGLRVGAKAGMALDHASSTGLPTGDQTANTTDFVFGPHLAFDYAMGGGLSLGAEANILFVTKSGSSAMTNLLGSVKFWF